MSTKGSSRFFKFFLDLELFAKIKKDLVFTHSQKLVFYIFVNNSRCKQNLENPKHALVDIGKSKRCAKYQQKILNIMAVGARQSL